MEYHTSRRRAAAEPRVSRYVFIGAAAAIALAACGGGNAATRGGSTSGSSAKAAGSVQVALILKNFTNPYFISMENSAQADAAQLGVRRTGSSGPTCARAPHERRHSRPAAA